MTRVPPQQPDRTPSIASFRDRKKRNPARYREHKPKPVKTLEELLESPPPNLYDDVELESEK